MAELENSELGVKVVVPDRPNVRQMLAWKGEATYTRGRDMYERLWAAAGAVIEAWECEDYPDLGKINIVESDDPKLAEIIRWTGLAVFMHFDAAMEVPKKK